MEVALLGVRGSCCIPHSASYGGDTTCFRVRSASGGTLFIDAGTGLRNDNTVSPTEGRCSILLTHVHWDHVFGLPFFAPLYRAGNTVDVYTPESTGNILETLFDGVHFPIRAEKLAARVRLIRYTPGESLHIEGIQVRTIPMPHPGGSVGVRLAADGHVVGLSGDCEITGQEPELESLLQGADMAVVDGQYSAKNYPRFKGWGHSCYEVWLDVAKKFGNPCLVFSHHDPESSDAMLDAARQNIQQKAQDMGLRVELARQGLVWNGREVCGCIEVVE